MEWLGIHDSQEDADRIRVIERSGIRIALLNYTYGTNAGQPRQPYVVDYLWDRAKIAGDIARAKELSDLVLVFPHWGTEGMFTPDAQQREWGQFFADQGVGAVIGGHPHTLQPVELLTGKDGNEMPCFWSLGNFISHMAKPENMLGGLARLTITKDSSGTYVSDYSLAPTMTWVFHGTGRDYRFRGRACGKPPDPGHGAPDHVGSVPQDRPVNRILPMVLILLRNLQTDRQSSAFCAALSVRMFLWRKRLSLRCCPCRSLPA